MITVQSLERVRPAPPPYLVTIRTDRRGVSVGVTADASSTVVEMTVHGEWSPQLGGQITATLGLCLAGPTSAVVIDLHDVDDRHGISLPFWVAAMREARLGPAPVRLALCPPPGTTLDQRLRHAGGPQPLIFTTVPEARRGIALRMPPSHRRFQTRLAPQPAAVQAARDLVTRACATWHLPEVRQDALLIMSELAANAVEHARTDAVATVVAGATGLHLTVRDGDTRYPHLAEPSTEGPLDVRGRGLRLIHAVASAWGVVPARSGKVVWATVPLPATI